jgi:putative spermidine/putrescine transport system substrate-binding protein
MIRTPITTRRTLLKGGAAALGVLAAPAILRAAPGEIVVGCAGSHSAWMEAIVLPHMLEKFGMTVLFEGTRSTVNLEKMRANRDAPYLSVVQMDDPVMILAVEEDLLRPMTPATVPSMTNLRAGTVHMDGMWCNYVQPWAGVAYNTGLLPGGVPSWAQLWDPAFKGKVILPSLQNTEGVWTLFMAAHLATGKPMAEAQYEIDAAFAKLAELKPNVLTVYSVMSQAFNLLEQGEISMLAGNFSSYALPRKAEGAPVDLATPKEGVFAQPSGVCLVKNGPNPELAEAYANELLSAELQSKLADFTASLPSHNDATSSVKIPEGVPLHSPDWAFVSKNRAEWIDRFDKLMAA